MSRPFRVVPLAAMLVGVLLCAPSTPPLLSQDKPVQEDPLRFIPGPRTTVDAAALVWLQEKVDAAKAKKDPPPAPATPILTLPDTVKAVPGRYFRLQATTNCKSIKWIIPSGLDNSLSDLLNDPTKQLLVGDSGTYTVQAIGTLNDVWTDFATCTVTIGTPPPPVPPTPPDPLTAALQTGYNADKDIDRATSLAFLQQVYAGLAGLAPTWGDVKTNAQALAKIQTAVAAPGVGLTATQVQNLRKAIAADFAAKFGTVATKAIDLTALATELSAVANALKGVK